ncbi:unnamed protein product [Rotaria sp. Silwood1]|nr:unnamed protein product [Rotaria sp. Silwood1]CAF0764044.1 unnamed protein product [Rotaria sp. Silwood1]CAF3325078.1 unnamed protein product [Rotaria sp. Silwood1]CAF4574445.1 unnamed protein product [Rotaria sp. Silwood1]
MPRKNAMRDNVSAVRSQLPHLSNLSREKIELALLYYELNVDETVEAFKRNGAIEALSGWTEMSNSRGNNSTKRANSKPTTRDNKTTSSSNGILRPSQRVSNIFQTFAEGGIPTITTNGNTSISNTETSLSSSFHEQSNNNLETYPSTDLSFRPCLSQDLTTNNSQSLVNGIESTENIFHDASNITINDEINSLTNHIDQGNHNINETNGYNGKSKRRRNIRDSNGSTSSMTLSHESTQQSLSNDIQQSTNNSITTTTKPVTKPSSSSNTTTFSNNRKLLTKSTKDLQRQTSTLSNVELSFENEIKSSVKRIDDVFKQIREIIKEREVELYLEIDKVKEQGLNIIHNRQQRAIELRQRMDRCDRLEPLEVDHLRNDVKQFVTERRYDLGEELTSSHRFQYDQTIIDALKNFGTVLRIDRKYDRSRTLSSSSSLVEQNSTTVEKTLPEKSIENIQTQLNNVRVSSSTLNEHMSSNNQQKPLPQRINHKHNFNDNNNNNGNYHENSHVPSLVNGFYQYYDDSNNYQNVNYRRRPQQQKYPQHFNENTRRTRPKPSSNNNNRRNGFNNSEIKTTHRQLQSSQTIAPPISNE